MGIVLPGRFDELIRIAIVRRFPGCPAGIRSICLSLVTLGLIDSAALADIASSVDACGWSARNCSRATAATFHSSRPKTSRKSCS